MSTSDGRAANKALIERIYRDGYNAGESSVFDECYTSDFIHHSKVLHDVAPGAAGERESMRRFRQAIPDVRFTVLQQVAEGHWVTARMRIEGTPVSGYGSLPMADGRFAQHVLALFRIRDGRVAEEWLFTDAASSP